MKSITPITAGIFSVTALSAAPTDAPKNNNKNPERPNVIICLIDDLGWSDLGCYGSTFYETPNIDRLSGQGVRFTNAYTTCHVSSPSRAALYTGRYPANINLTDWLPGRRDFPFQSLHNVEVEQNLSSKEITIAEVMRDNGYKTGFVGKWHLGEEGSTPQDHGFDTHVPNGYLKGWPAAGYFAPFAMNGYNGQPGDYLTDNMTDEALNYIEAHESEPFLLILSHFAVHDPVQGPPDLVEKYRKKLLELPPSQIPPFILEGNPDDPDPLTREELTALLEDDSYKPHKALPNRTVKIKQIQDNIEFAAMVESMDRSIGRVMDKLAELDLEENTIIVFLSDNGGMSAANYGGPNRVIGKNDLNRAYSTSSLPLRGGKGWLYEGGVRIPMIIRWKSHTKKGLECDAPVVSIDVLPTVLSMTGITPPADNKYEGVDISSLTKGKKATDRPIFWHFPHYSNHGLQSPGGAVRYGKWKLLEYYERGTVQLFNLADDPSEQNDLAGVMPAKADELRDMLHEWREQVDAREMSDNKSYDLRIDHKRQTEVNPDRWWMMSAEPNGGVFEHRLNLWRTNRMWYMAGLPFMVGGFESRPGEHPWQGEHVGKWLHAATLAYNHTGDAKLKSELDLTVQRLLATADKDGYIGTYTSDSTFMVLPEDSGAQMWDVWTQRYNIYGLLIYESYFPNVEVINACRRMGNLLIGTYSPGKYDLTLNGTRDGISSTTLLESMVMLYERTGEKKYLDFAEHIVTMSEGNPKHALMTRMLTDGDVVMTGGGKAYQIMSNLLGYMRLYQVTGKQKYLETVTNGWKTICEKHLLTTGGPWTRFMNYNGNKECFAYTEAFNPAAIVVENCCNVTWMQLNLQLYDLTGKAQYLSLAEQCLYNDLYGHQLEDGVSICYYTIPNQNRPPFNKKPHCCGSRHPRALELMADHIAGEIDNCLSIGILTPSTIKLNSKFGGGELVIDGNYPFGNRVEMSLDTECEPHIYKEFSIEFRLPVNTTAASIKVNGEDVTTNVNGYGFTNIRRIWEKGDKIEIILNYHLKAFVQHGEGGNRWGSFMYGPIALAQKISSVSNPEPFAGKLRNGESADKLLEQFEITHTADSWYFDAAGVRLIPYYQAGSQLSGPMTYFKL